MTKTITKLSKVANEHPAIRDVFKLFDEYNHDCYLVGGTIRDILMGQVIGTDLDFVTNGSAKRSKDILVKSNKFSTTLYAGDPRVICVSN